MAGQKHKYTDDELDLLTEDERAGLLDDDVVDDDADDEDIGDGEEDTSAVEAAAAAAEKAIADKAVDDKAKADAAAAAAAEADDDDKAKSDAAAAAAAAAAEEGTGVDDEQVSSPPVSRAAIPNWQAPADAEQKLADIKTRKAELATKFDEGEIDRTEYTAEVEKLDEKRDEIRKAVDRAEMARDMAVADWSNSVVPAWMASHKEYEPGTMLYQMLDMRVRQYQASAEFANPLDPAILDRAHADIQKEFARATGKPLPSAEVKKEAKKQPPKREMPPSLTGIPAAVQEEVGDGSQFAHLDHLNGEAYELALAKLTDAEREAYLNQ